MFITPKIGACAPHSLSTRFRAFPVACGAAGRRRPTRFRAFPAACGAAGRRRFRAFPSTCGAAGRRRPGISTPTRLLVSWPGALQGPIRPTLSTGLGGRMAFFLLLFLSSGSSQQPGRWAKILWGTPFTSRPWGKTPSGRLRAPRQIYVRMTPYSLIGLGAEAHQIRDLAASVGLRTFTESLSGHGRKGR